jgi:hypothetical protein
LVVTPSKLRVYQDRWPWRLEGARFCPAFSDVQQRLRDEAGVPVIALTEPLLRARETSDGELYGPSDTHWRCAGSYVGYREALGWLRQRFPGLEPMGNDDMEVGVRADGDLAVMLMLHGLLPPHDQTCLPKHRRATARSEGDSTLATIVTEHPDESLPRLFVLGDSTIGGPVYLLGEHFSHARFVRKENFDPTDSVEFAPDAVLHMVGERMLFADDTLPAVPSDGAELAERFLAGSRVFELERDAIEMLHEVVLDRSEGGFDVSVTGEDPYLVVNPLDIPEDRIAIVRIEVESEESVELQLFYAAGQPYAEERSIRHQLGRGRRVVYFEVPGSPGLNLRLDIADKAKHVVLKAFELATLPR